MDTEASSLPMERPAGFWIRFTATWIDAALIYLALTMIEHTLNAFNIHIPFEISFLVFSLVYMMLFTTLHGATVGKWLCGLTVEHRDGGSVGFVHAVVRETVGKLLSALGAGFGFWWIGFTRKKRGWHDYLTWTRVSANPAVSHRGRLLTVGVLLITGTWLTVKAAKIVGLYFDWKRMELPQNVRSRYERRDPALVTEVSSLSAADEQTLGDWLNINGKKPLDYVVDIASKHQVTIFGEAHGQKDYLDFLNNMIPELYHRAGVTVVAMEVCPAEDNAQLEKLVTASEFDRDLALELARHAPWGVWGSKEYWDVFETIWKLNSTIPPSEPKMRIVGIDSRIDWMSFGLLGTGENARKGPMWEKLRIGRCLIDFARLTKRDELMGRHIEQEILEKNVRGIVWVGYNHAFVNYRQPIVIEGKSVREMGRMGYMLHAKYGDRIFTVRLHVADLSPSIVDPAYQGSGPHITDYFEAVMKRGGNRPVGFTTEGSPFAMLRDSNSYYYHFQPTVAFSDLASGYVFLRPIKEMVQCTWLDGYISKDMFIKNKPYYEAFMNRPLRDVEELNRLRKGN